jgi:hypothetical protein
MKNNDRMTIPAKGYIRVFEEANPSNTIFAEHNTVCLNTQYLFARMMANISDPVAGVWGLAIGAGAPDWPLNNQPDALPTQQNIITPILRKPCSYIQFVDENLNVIPNEGYSNIVDFQTILNATTDSINTPIRELGLIGGGSTASSTTLGAAPFFNNATQASINDTNTAILINYKTLPPLVLPAGINFIMSWVLQF